MTDYDKTYAEFRLEVPEFFNFAGDVVDKWAQDPQKLAMLWVDDTGNEVRKTFLDLVKASKKLANALTAQGVKRDDVIMVVLPRNTEWWETVTASIRMGALLAPGTSQLTTKDLAFRANKSQAACLITTHDIAAKFEQVQDKCPTVKTKIVISRPREGWIFYDEALAAASEQFETVKTRSTDNCLVYFTSGTVGFPKMALHTHASYPIGHQSPGASGWTCGRRTCTGMSATPAGPRRPGAAILVPGTAARRSSSTTPTASTRSRPLTSWSATRSPRCAAPRPSTAC